MTLENGPVHVECIIMRNFMAFAIGAELGGLSENYQNVTCMRKALAEMGHLQSPTPVAMENAAANSIVNGTAKQKISRAIDMIFYWVRDRIRQNHLHILREEGKKNLADYVTKHHPIWHHRSMRPKYVKATKTYIENQKYWQTDTMRECAGTNNPGEL